ncbi:MAG: hypothetical protein M5T61_09950 [Acidimicrobiia bacterium]|nr:hypothetical protein [Acidimicrobiia bacterium]
MTDALPLDLLVRGGTVVTDGAVRRADVGVRGGVVAGIWEDGGPQAAASVVDATGKIVMPGAIDAHFHTNTGWAQMAVKADDPTSATRSAAAGGVTTVITFVWGNAGQPLPEFLGAYFEMASQLSITDFSAHCGGAPRAGPDRTDPRGDRHGGDLIQVSLRLSPNVAGSDDGRS